MRARNFELLILPWFLRRLLQRLLDAFHTTLSFCGNARSHSFTTIALLGAELFYMLLKLCHGVVRSHRQRGVKR